MNIKSIILKTATAFMLVFLTGILFTSCDDKASTDPKTNPLNNTKWEIVNSGILFTPVNEPDLAVELYLKNYPELITPLFSDADRLIQTISSSYYIISRQSETDSSINGYAFLKNSVEGGNIYSDIYVEFKPGTNESELGDMDYYQLQHTEPRCLKNYWTLKYKENLVYDDDISWKVISTNQTNPETIILMRKIMSNTVFANNRGTDMYCDRWAFFTLRRNTNTEPIDTCITHSKPSPLTGTWNIDIKGTDQAGSTAPEVTGTLNLTQDTKGKLTGTFTEKNPNGDIVYNLDKDNSSISLADNVVSIEATDGFLTWYFTGRFKDNDGTNADTISGSIPGETELDEVTLELKIKSPSSARLDNGNYGTFTATR